MKRIKFEICINSEGEKYSRRYNEKGKNNWEWDGSEPNCYASDSDTVLSSYSITEKEYNKEVAKTGSYIPVGL